MIASDLVKLVKKERTRSFKCVLENMIFFQKNALKYFLVFSSKFVVEHKILLKI